VATPTKVTEAEFAPLQVTHKLDTVDKKYPDAHPDTYQVPEQPAALTAVPVHKAHYTEVEAPTMKYPATVID